MTSSLLRVIGYSVLSGLVVGVIFAARGDVTDAAISGVIGSMYALSIAVPSMLVFRWIGPRIRRQSAFVQWAIYLAVLVVLCALGSLVVGLLIVAFGWSEMAAFWSVYNTGVKIALVLAVPSTVGALAVSRIRNQMAEAERLATAAKLASLESRIRPHFLFNALNSAIALIPEEPARAEALLERFAALLRFSLDAKGSVTLREELRIVEDYLEIERTRFGDRLRYTIDCPDEAAAIAVPAFSIQTLVENAIKYAVAPSKTGGTVEVVVRSVGKLEIEVRDDGPGFASTVWPAGHGLDTLRARLDALHGGSITCSAPGSSGARVTITVPA
ncbi:MAG: histidine kinase [Kofleriaceae bacterium]